MKDNLDDNPARSIEINLMDYWTVVLKRKRGILSFAIPLFVFVTVMSFAVRPTYTAKGTLLIEKEPNILSFEEVLQIESFNDDYFQTQYKLLQSRSLANAVIERQKLFENVKFARKSKKRTAGAGRDDPAIRSVLIDRFLACVAIKPIRATRLVEVTFKDHDPKFAAEMVNALFDAFIDMNINAKYEATAQATEFLAAQIEKIRSEIDKDERAIQQYGADKNIVTLSDKETTIIEKLGELNRALTEAQIERVNKETYYNAIKDVAPEFIPEALANPLIQRLREDYNKLNREYLKMQDRFKEDYPELQRLKTELESAQGSLKAEAQNLQKGAHSDWQASLQREWSLTAAFDRQKQEAIQLNSNAISYNQLKIELENKKSLLENLMRRESETGVSARLKGLRTSNVRIVDRAEAPLHPSSPKKKLNMLLALLVGLFGGVGLAFLVERLDDSIKTFEDVTKSTGLPSLGIIPAFGGNDAEMKPRDESWPEKMRFWRPWRKMKNETPQAPEAGSKPEATIERAQDKIAAKGGEATEGVGGNGVSSIDLISFLSPKSNVAESYRSLRTALLLSSAEPRPQCLAISSALPKEGKTTTLANLAVTLAQSGKKILVVDADLRKPRLHEVFGIRNLNGLTNYLTGKKDKGNVIKITEIPNLFLINAGPVPPNPLELLSSDKMTSLIATLRETFDYVLFDTPPILAVTDALDLGSKLDGVILVVWGEKTSREALKRTREKLDMVKARTLGVILNNVAVRRHDHYYRQGYYGHYGEPE